MSINYLIHLINMLLLCTFVSLTKPQSIGKLDWHFIAWQGTNDSGSLRIEFFFLGQYITQQSSVVTGLTFTFTAAPRF